MSILAPYLLLAFTTCDAELIYDEHKPLSEHEIVHMTVWRVPHPVEGSLHAFKYRLAFVVNGDCVLRYDNERGKGDHKHVHGSQASYTFTSPARLLADFLSEVEAWRMK